MKDRLTNTMGAPRAGMGSGSARGPVNPGRYLRRNVAVALRRRTALEARRGPVSEPGTTRSRDVNYSVSGTSTSARKATSPTKRYKANVAKKNRVTAAYEKQKRARVSAIARTTTRVKGRNYKAPGKK